jgi:4-hydroxy 2-oxovalerate aldolase
MSAYKIKSYYSKYTDKSHLQQISKNKNIGVFYIPGIGNPKDIDLAREYGIDFIKIGTNPNRITEQIKAIHQCNKNKIQPISFIMKSHLTDPKEFAQKANVLFNEGSKIVYLADSMGCMLPEDIKSYFFETKKKNPRIKLGFHGHDNLGLATINSLLAFDLGFYMIDMTLQGIGRSGGNLSTEKFISILKKKSNLKINFKKLLEFSKYFVRKTNTQNVPDIIDTILGYKKIHSGDMQKVLKEKGKNLVEKLLNSNPQRYYPK